MDATDGPGREELWRRRAPRMVSNGQKGSGV